MQIIREKKSTETATYAINKKKNITKQSTETLNEVASMQ